MEWLVRSQFFSMLHSEKTSNTTSKMQLKSKSDQPQSKPMHYLSFKARKGLSQVKQKDWDSIEM
jgi:hypothetical protein